MTLADPGDHRGPFLALFLPARSFSKHLGSGGCERWSSLSELVRQRRDWNGLEVSLGDVEL